MILVNLAENKPKLVEKIINGASKSASRCVEIASGSAFNRGRIKWYA